MKLSWRRIARVTSLSGVLFLTVPPLCMAQTATPTVTTLTITPSGPVSAGTVLTLTAAVTSGSNIVSPGQVIFCNAAAAHCLDSAILGQAQLTSAGTAILRLRLGAGSHSVKAVFQGTPGGTPALSGSTSSSEAVQVAATSASDATNTTVSAYGAAGNYTFIGTVLGLGQSGPTGAVSFLDTTNGDASLGTASLGATLTPGFSVFPAPATGQNLVQIAVADFNNDGIPDLASLNDSDAFGGYAGDLDINLGRGDGTFQETQDQQIFGDYPYAMIVADFNSDGTPDIAVMTVSSDNDTYDDGTVSVLGHSYFIGLEPVVGPAADFNGDGIPDLSFASWDAADASYVVTLLLSNGDGTFTLKSLPNQSLIYPIAMVPGDFNGDGLVDLAIADQVQGGAVILLNNGDDTFTTLKSTPLELKYGPYTLSIAEGDFNGDGILDLVVANADEGSLTVSTGNGDGTFKARSLPPLFWQPWSLVAGDFNGDGITDLAVADYSNQIVTILAGKGDVTFANVSATGVRAPELMESGDFNGDGVIDLFTSSIQSENILLGGLEARAGIRGVSLGAGNHNIIARYAEDAHYSGSDSAPLSIFNTTGSPQLTPRPGTYSFTQNVTLTDQTPGAAIYYTLDGTQPTTASARYTAPIEVSWQATINAIAVSPEAANSEVTSGAYLIERELPPPTFSPSSGTYGAPFTFCLANDSADCKSGTCVLAYSVNGEGFKEYTGPVTITRLGTTLVKAITTKWHYKTSDSEATYTITP